MSCTPYSLVRPNYTPIFVNPFPSTPCNGSGNCAVSSVTSNKGVFVQSFAMLSDNSMFLVGTRSVRPGPNFSDNFSAPLIGGQLFYSTSFFNDSNPFSFNLPLACPQSSLSSFIFCCAWNPSLTPDGDTTLALLLDDLFTIQFYSVRQLLTEGTQMGQDGMYTPIYPTATIIMSNLGWSSISFDLNNNLYGMVPQSAGGSNYGSLLYRIVSGQQSGAVRATPVAVCGFQYNAPSSYQDNSYASASDTSQPQYVFCDNAALAPTSATYTEAASNGLQDLQDTPTITPSALVYSYGPFYINFTQVVFSYDGNMYLVGTYPFYNLWNQTPCCAYNRSATINGKAFFGPVSPCYYTSDQSGSTVDQTYPDYAVSKYNGLYAVSGGVPSSVLSAGAQDFSSLPIYTDSTSGTTVTYVSPNPYSQRNNSIAVMELSIVPQWVSVSPSSAVMLTSTLSFALLA